MMTEMPTSREKGVSQSKAPPAKAPPSTVMPWIMPPSIRPCDRAAMAEPPKKAPFQNFCVVGRTALWRNSKATPRKISAASMTRTGR